jgi:gliding motility-associated-like protein
VGGNNTPALTGLQGGTYMVTVTDNAGCSASVASTILGVSAPFSVSAGPDIIECTNTSVTLQAVVTGPSVNGGPFIYQWMPTANITAIYAPTTVASPTTPTNYVIAVLSGACVAYDTVHVVIGKLTLTTSTTNETCYGYTDGTATVAVQTGTAPYQYSWSNGETTANISTLLGGTYTVTVTDGIGCSASADATVQSTTPIFFSNPVVTNPKCFGGNDGSITIAAAGGANGITYLWSTGETTTTIQNLSANLPYSITATDVNQCSADTAVSLTEPTKVTVSIIGTDVKCFDGSDGSAIATAVGGTPNYAYIWQNGIATATPTNMAAGNYRVTVTDVNSCSAQGDITINQPDEISITAQSIAPACPGTPTGTINANATGGTNPYMFDLIYNSNLIGSNAAGEFTDLDGGDYVIHLTDANLCEHSANLSLLTPNPDVFVLTTDSTSCYGTNYSDGAVHVVALSVFNQPYQYSIDGGAPQFSGDFYNATAGTHTITTVNNAGCISEQIVVVPEPAQGVITITTGDSTIQLGDNIQLNSSFSPYSNSTIVSYNWSAAQGLSCTDCPNPVATPYDNNNEYTLAVVYNNGCVAVTSVKVQVEGHPPVFTPNAFSPNGDGNNDVFLVYGEAIKKVDLKIFNRWGELIFESTNQYNGWDGTYKGELQNPGVYTFITTVTYLDGKTANKNGSLTLVR